MNIWDDVLFTNDRLAKYRSMLFMISMFIWAYLNWLWLEIIGQTPSQTDWIIGIMMALSGFGMLLLFVWLVASPTWEYGDE